MWLEHDKITKKMVLFNENQNHDVLMAIFCGKSKKEWINTIINLENNSKKISGFEF